MAAASLKLADRDEDESVAAASPWLAWTRSPQGVPSLSAATANDDIVARPATPFSDLELRVIAIGGRDPLRLVRPDSRSGRLWRMLFGIEAPLPFADRRLEALRRLVVASRRGARRFATETATALQAGVTPLQIQHLRDRAFSGSF